jgi:hypothetical protein
LVSRVREAEVRRGLLVHSALHSGQAGSRAIPAATTVDGVFEQQSAEIPLE